MISFIALKKNSAVFQSFSGLTLLAFYKLLPSFEQAYEDDLFKREQERSTPRQRERGGGRTGAFKRLEDKLVFILFYFKFYPVQEVQGFFFGMGQSQAWEWIHRLTPILNRALGYEKQLPARKTRDVQQILESCPGLEFIIDGTERPIRRPKDKERREKYYSGKKKRHTLKNNVVSEKRTRKVKVLSPTCEGKKHDKKLADEQDLRFPKGSKVWKDTGFQGYEPDDVITYQPKKKPKGKELTPEEKEQNRQISIERISVEHSIGGVKVFAIVREIYRNLTTGFEDLIMETACGLHNLRLDYPLSA
jgi:hypothetical protein